jgi:putative membrane protein
MMGYWYGMQAFGWIGMLLFWALVVVAIVYLVRYLNTQSSSRESERQPDSVDSAQAILRERFARGEIDQEEFEQRKRSLN